MVPEIKGATGKTFCHFGPFFGPNNPKNQNFEKMKNSPGNIITLHKCTKNNYYYATLFMRYNV